MPSTNAKVALDSLAGPRISFDTIDVDLGRLELGRTAEHIYRIENPGTQPLRIFHTQTSCGCTAAVIDDSTILPGQVSRLRVTFDSHNKGTGPISKSILITSNAVVDSLVTARFRVVLFEDTVAVHKRLAGGKPAMMHLDGIFKGDCASCHSQKGVGLYGADLFEADCAQCHGSEASGKPGPAVNDKRIYQYSEKILEKLIRSGKPEHNMPGFALAEFFPTIKFCLSSNISAQ